MGAILHFFIYGFLATLVLGSSFLMYIMLRYEVTITLDHKPCERCGVSLRS